MKIQSIETFTNEFVCFVKVTTDDSSIDWGAEPSPAWLANSQYAITTLS